MLKRIPLVLVLAFTFACSESATEPTAQSADDVSATPQFNVGAVIHHASLGSGDACDPAGCDANFSLVANMHADGSVKGQWHDQLAGGAGVHIVVDCLTIVGNEAWVSGVVSKLAALPFLEGRRAITRVADNGSSANDPADQISATWVAGFNIPPHECGDTPDLPLSDISRGQVKVY